MDRLLIKPTGGQAGAGAAGNKSDEGTRFRGQIRSESPDTTGPDPGGSPPKTPVTTHSQIRRRSIGVQPAAMEGVLGHLGTGAVRGCP
jgi:hypothetical protein